jgi:RNA polymerase sigma-70 factor (ECF subfamily)
MPIAVLAPEAEVAALFDEHRAPLHRFLLSLGLSPHDADEVVQEVFLALLHHLRANKPRTNLRAWLFQVAHNQAARARRRPPVDNLPPPAPAPTPEALAIDAQRRLRIAAVIAALPPKDRACLALRAEGLRYREIAQILGISVPGVALALDRAAKRLEQVR